LLCWQEAGVPYGLSDVDEVRNRLGVGYAAAKRALDASDGDIIAALAAAETEAAQASLPCNLDAIISELTEEVKAYLDGEAICGLRVTLGGQVVDEVPVALEGVGAALLAVLCRLVAHVTLEVMRKTDAAREVART
jgi:hypothetical protein